MSHLRYYILRTCVTITLCLLTNEMEKTKKKYFPDANYCLLGHLNLYIFVNMCIKLCFLLYYFCGILSSISFL